MADIYPYLRPLLHLLPPEAAHNLGLFLLHYRLLPRAATPARLELETEVFGLRFSNPVGLAAGFDKNAVAVDGLLAQGFGFVETGTVTPRPQAGNAKPRIFRLVEDEAVINRLGFNNGGLFHYLQNFNRRSLHMGIAGANIGKNKDTDDASADYVAGLQAVYPYADYITVNISSPNTQGLRALQQKEALVSLLAALNTARNECQQSHNRRVPLLLKVAPDLEQQGREDIAEAVLAHGIDGIIVSNTTVSRPPTLRSTHCAEQGGLSGKPLFALSTDNLRQFYRLLGHKVPLIGVGGIASAQDAYEKIRAGASLVQLYTALVYQGFGVVRRICDGLPALLAKDGFSNIRQAVGTDVK
jgi:dihydroorotate dehydrogenase